MAATPSIFFGSIDTAALEAEIVAYYEALTGKTVNPSDPEFMLIATIAYVRALSLQAIERAGKANLVEFSTGVNLDYIAALIGLDRILATAAVTKMEFTLVTGHGNVVIPAGTLVSSQDGLGVFSTNEDVNVAIGVDIVTVNATCTTDGLSGNGYAIGAIKIIQNPQPYLASATNLDSTSGGGEEETDAALRSRWPLALEALSVAGPGGAYEFHALSAAQNIVSVKVLGPEDLAYNINPGEVEIRVLVDTGTPNQSILDAVFDACDPTTVRPMCDTVLVYGAVLIPYSIVAEITAFDGADTAGLPALVQAALQAYADTQGNVIGSDIVETALQAAGKVTGVKKLNFPGWSDISVDFRHFARATGITATVVATEEP